MHSEAIFWILGRSAIVGCIFFLLSLIFFLKREQKIFFFLSIVSAQAAWLSYESSWILPAVLFAISFIDIKTKHSTFKKEATFVSAAILFFLIYLIARNYFIHELVGQYEAASFLNFDIQTLTANFLKLIMRSWLPPFTNSTWIVVLFVLVVAALSFLYFKLKGNSVRIFFLILIGCWLISLIPSVPLVSIPKEA